MKNILSFGAAVGVALLALAGCSEDTTAPTDINKYFELKKGDTFTYARYDRDMQNQRVESSKTMHKWVVLETGLSFEGKTAVTRMLQLNYDATGSTVIAPPDTLYIRSGADGEIFMNVVSATLSRIPIAAAFADSIPFAWFKVSDTKNAGAATWLSLGSSSGILKDVSYPVGGFPIELRIQITADGYHKGKVPLTLGTASYPNAFHTDHTVRMDAKIKATGSQIIKDSLHLAYDVDITNGIIRQAMLSDSVTATPPTGAVTEAVPGFEMVLVSAVRAK